MDPKMLELLISELDISAGSLPLARPTRPARPVLLRRHRSGRTEVPPPSPPHSSPSRRGRNGEAGRHVRRSEAARCAAAPPLRLIRDERSASLSRQPMIHMSWRSSRPSTAPPGLTVIDALIEASEAGKQVLALVEIKARFDEQANIAWACRLSSTLSRGLWLTRAEDPLQARWSSATSPTDPPYAHIGTGNYNPKTARLYEDIGLLTANPIVTEDIGRLFNHLRGWLRDPVQAAAGCTARYPQRADRSDQSRDRQSRGRKARSHQDQGQLRSWTRRPSMRSTAPPVPVCRWTCGYAALVRSGLVCRVSARTSECASSAASSSTADSSGSQTTDRLSRDRLRDLMHRNLDRRVEVLVSITNPAHVSRSRSYSTWPSTTARHPGICSRTET